MEPRTIEIRRHAKRRKPGSNLTTEGIRRAQSASTSDREYALVVTSSLPRALQTAVAMGHGVDEEDWTMASMGEVAASYPWEAGFGEMQHAIRTDAVASAYSALQTLQLRHYLGRIATGEAVLVVSHGGIAEAGIIGLLGDLDASSFGPSLDYCEGARIQLDGDSVRRVELLRFEGEVEYTALELEP